MEYWMFRACCLGYADRMQDLSALNVQAGYWVAYYNNTKHAKKPDTIIAQMQMKAEAKKHGGKKPAPDVETFLAREKRRQAYLKLKE